ncbi:MAG TPA: hypothetical protein VFZ52_19300 [Chryseolinea sp.]
MARKKKQPTEEPQENLDNTDDTFGLPEVEYQPLKRDEPVKAEEPVLPDEPITPEEKIVIINESTQVIPEPPAAPDPATQFRESELAEPEPVQENTYEEKRTYESEHQTYQPTYTYKEEPANIWPKVLGVLLLLAIIGGVVWYLAVYRPKQEQARLEQERKEQAFQEEARRKEDERRAAAKRAEDEAKNAAAQVEAKPAIGTIETLSGRSGRYYVVIASSIDGDLIMDYAKKLSATGVSTKIIPPFGKSSFHRLAVAEGDTYATTQETADGMKGGDYGNKVWVVKY